MTQAFGEIPWSPQLLQPIDGRPVILGAVLFDGTNNDRLNVPVGERKTVVAHIHDELENNPSMACEWRSESDIGWRRRTAVRRDCCSARRLWDVS
ncbi:hypothetical protein [Paraburkholderia fungorum]|uniref:hypothetical protein n=1 Tax=Paraburkholderia fungorum TaxID=134537 RepID=UPI0038781522